MLPCAPAQVSEWRKHLLFCYGTGSSGDGQPAIDNLPNQDAVESQLLLAGHATAHAEPFKVRSDDSLHISRAACMQLAQQAIAPSTGSRMAARHIARLCRALPGCNIHLCNLLICHCHVITGGDAPTRHHSKGKTGHARFLHGGG